MTRKKTKTIRSISHMAAQLPCRSVDQNSRQSSYSYVHSLWVLDRRTTEKEGNNRRIRCEKKTNLLQPPPSSNPPTLQPPTTNPARPNDHAYYITRTPPLSETTPLLPTKPRWAFPFFLFSSLPRLLASKFNFTIPRALPATPHMPGAFRGSCPLLLPVAAR